MRIFLFLVILFTVSVGIAVFIFFILKDKRKKPLNSKSNKITASKNVDIIQYKIDMACERTNNHIFFDSSISIYDKLDIGSEKLSKYIKDKNYNISNVCRRILK